MRMLQHLVTSLSDEYEKSEENGSESASSSDNDSDDPDQTDSSEDEDNNDSSSFNGQNSDENILTDEESETNASVDKTTLASVKRKRSADSDICLKPQKTAKSNADVGNKAPCTDDLHTLKENEHLLNTSLFHLQIKELLSEIRVKQKWRNLMEEYLDVLFKEIKNISHTQGCDINKQKWITKQGVKIPMVQQPKKVQGNFQFLPPTDIFTIGSFPSDTCIKPNAHVDIAVVMPKECVHTMDYLNQRYFRKRALYLSCIALNLNQWDGQSELQFMYHENNHMKPVLLIKPKGKLGLHFSVCLHVVLESGKFKMNRFHVCTNNVRENWFFESSEEESTNKGIELEKTHGGATPYYNALALTDMTMKSNCDYMEMHLKNATNIQQGICLLKVWLHQRQLDMGHGGFSGFVMTMYVLYLLKKHKLNKHMNNYQVLRSTLFHLGKANWIEEGITLSEDVPTSQKHTPTLKEFHGAFPVVFIDISGYNNICAAMTHSTFERVKYEAQLSLEYLETASVDGFDMLFMTPMPFLRTFDQIFHLSELEQLWTLCHDEEKCDLKNKLLDHCGNFVYACLNHIILLLHQAIGKRVKLIDVKLHPPSKWAINKKPPTCIKSQSMLTFGMLLNTDTCYSVLEKGPAAENSTEAQKFRSFWGDLAELRRFQDGTINEAVFWKGCETIADKRKILGRALKHILSRHCHLDEKSIISLVDPLDKLLKIPVKSDKNSNNVLPYGTGEEQTLDIIRSFDELCKNIRSLTDLPLTINTIQGTSPVFRYCETFPAMRSVSRDMTKTYRDKRFPMWSETSPHFIQTMTVMCLLEGSGKWPDSAEAVRRIKAALLIQLSRKLEQVHNLITSVNAAYLNVLKNGYVFQLYIGTKREIGLVKLTVTPEGLVKTCDTEQSLALERHMVAVPKLTSTLHGIQQQHSSFCNTVRLAKRWVSAHMMLNDYVPEAAIELISAYLYLHPAPFKAANSSFPAFIRFLHFLSSWNWKLHPLIVNLNNDFSKEDYEEITDHFNKERANLPLMYIATPGDRKSQIWTKKNPTALTLNRLVLLAKESLQVLERIAESNGSKYDYFQIFRPPLEIFDILIYLDTKHISRRVQQIGGNKAKKLKFDVVDKTYMMPVVDYDPVQNYLKELREAYGDLALFFHDLYGGEIIGVVWKPNVFEPKTFSSSHVNSHQPKSSGREVELCPNVDAIVEDFKFIGRGLFDRIELNKQTDGS